MERDIGTIIVFFFTYVLHSITGFAGNALAFPLVSLLEGVSEAKVIMNGIAFLSAVYLSIASFKDINWVQAKRMLKFMCIGICAGYLICLYISSEDFLLLCYGVFVITIVIRKLVTKKEKEKSETRYNVILITAGLIQGMFLSGGPVLVLYAIHKLPEKKEFRATINFIWLVVYTVMIVLQGVRREYTSHNVTMILIAAVPLMLGTYLGNTLLERISKKMFLKLTYTLLLVMGILLTGRGLYQIN